MTQRPETTMCGGRIRMIPARGPRPAWAGEPASASMLAAMMTPPDTDDVEESIRRMREISGSISVGRPPRKADYRARWRYNGEEFDDAE